MLRSSLSKVIRRSNCNSAMFALRGGHGPAKPIDNGLQPVIKHHNGHDDVHHEKVKTASLDHRFISKGTNFFDGNRGSSNVVVGLDHQFHQLNGLPLLQ